MSKRSSDSIISSQRLSQAAPFKRAKKEKTPEPEVTFVDDALSSIADTSSEAEEELASPVHDPEFYYEDGSVTFRVGDVLFKIHASLLKTESRDFEKTFDVPPKLAEATKSRGSCDENPIIIPDTKASQFRNLMELIYRPHYLGISPHNANEWQQFIFYLNVCKLSNRFVMKRIEEWARPELVALFQTSGKKILEGASQASAANEYNEDDEDKAPAENQDAQNVNAGSEKKTEGGVGGALGTPGGAGAGTANPTGNPSNPTNSSSQNPNPNATSNGTSNTAQPNIVKNANNANSRDNPSRSSSVAYEDDSDKEEEDNGEETDGDETKGDIALPPEEEEDPEFQFMDALLYAGSVLDSSLQCDVRNVLQYYCVHEEDLSVGTLADLFKVQDLKEKDPSMFGFLSIVLLDRGNQVWIQDMFTRMDRMAFFSAQSYLTPFPDSLKSLVVVPLFTKLISSKSFATIFSDASTKKSCAEECYTKAFTYWQEEFDEDYYADVGNKSTLAPVKALITIPRRRLDLAEKLLASECEHECHLKLLSQVDREVQGLHARLAEYYQGIE